jgi:hypothetical protein
MYNEKALNSVQARLPGFSAMYHYTKFGRASIIEVYYYEKFLGMGRK